jgi:hypothetical protein
MKTGVVRSTVKKRLFGDVSMPGRRRLQLAKFCPSDSEESHCRQQDIGLVHRQKVLDFFAATH